MKDVSAVYKGAMLRRRDRATKLYGERGEVKIAGWGAEMEPQLDKLR